MRFRFVPFAILLAATVARAQTNPITEWMKANAVPLSTAEAGHGFADMEPLRKMVGNARIVALGEATHGTREFFQLKHRMLEFLATEMGFGIFAIEANMPEAYKLNDYVLNGVGDPVLLLRGMYFWTWNTEEVLAMVKWMREFNASGKGRLQFTGFDMQTTTVAIANVRAYVAANEPAYETKVVEATALTDSVRAWQEVYNHLSSSAPSTPEGRWAVQNARIVLQAAQMRRGVVTRDESMANNIHWILNENPDAKIVVWAHNGHVTMARNNLAGIKMMGEHLRGVYGPRMTVFGFAFNEGSFRAKGQAGDDPIQHTVTPAPAESLDAMLSSTKLPIFALDLRTIPSSGPVADWFRQERKTRWIGALYSRGSQAVYWANINAARTYDAVLFVDKTTAAKGLPFR